jgi:thiol:disulfide interchange protein
MQRTLWQGWRKWHELRLTVLAIAAVVLGLAGRAGTTRDAALAQGKAKKSDAVVKVTAKVTPDKPGTDGQQVVTVMLDIEKGWHIYANPVGHADLVESQTVVKVTAKEPPEVKIDYPPGQLAKDSIVGDYKIYEGKVAIKAYLRRARGDTGPLEVSVTFQSCNDKSCLLPATVKLPLP